MKKNLDKNRKIKFLDFFENFRFFQLKIKIFSFKLKNQFKREKFDFQLKKSNNYKKIKKIMFSIFVEIVLHFEKNMFFNIFLPMSMQNFPKIPKIALRKTGNERKHVKNAIYKFFDTVYMILVTFGYVLRITTL